MEVTLIAQRIRGIRRELAISQESLARELGVSLAAVSGWENDRRRPSYKSIRKLAELSGKPISYFYDEDGVAA